MEHELVGRQRQRVILSGWLDEAVGGRGRLVLLHGEAGIGKTSLARALVVDARKRGLRAAWGPTPEHLGAPAFWPWIRVLATLGAPGPARRQRHLRSPR